MRLLLYIFSFGCLFSGYGELAAIGIVFLVIAVCYTSATAHKTPRRAS